MKFRIEKINEEKYAIVFIENDIKGFYITKSELKELKSNIDEMIAYNRDVVGDKL